MARAVHTEYFFVGVRLELQELHRYSAKQLHLLLIQPVPAGRRLWLARCEHVLLEAPRVRPAATDRCGPSRASPRAAHTTS